MWITKGSQKFNLARAAMGELQPANTRGFHAIKFFDSDGIEMSDVVVRENDLPSPLPSHFVRHGGRFYNLDHVARIEIVGDSAKLYNRHKKVVGEVPASLV